MAQIPGVVYLIVGLVVIGYSRLIEAKNPAANIKIFFWVGLVFLFIGVFKTIIHFVLARSSTPELAAARGAAHKVIRQRVGGDATQLICSECGAKLHPKSRYCNWCGAPVQR